MCKHAFFSKQIACFCFFSYVSIHLRKCKNLQPPFIFSGNVEQSKGAKLYVHIHIHIFFFFCCSYVFVIELKTVKYKILYKTNFDNRNTLENIFSSLFSLLNKWKSSG